MWEGVLNKVEITTLLLLVSERIINLAIRI